MAPSTRVLVRRDDIINQPRNPEIVIIGGGFYGCCLALCLRSISDHVTILEREPELMGRASRTNQARIHTGFHYPRSILTAMRSKALQVRFAQDFRSSVRDDFTMLYAIARQHSKVNAQRFHRMFSDMGAPIAPAVAADAALFDPTTIEAVFACQEFAFDWRALRTDLERKMARSGIEIRHGYDVASVQGSNGHIDIIPHAGSVISADVVFNVTYSGINRLLGASGIAQIPMKHELAEISLMIPPDELASKAVTVMDGPFFSFMPFPAESLYSLTHVRYTPHFSWTDSPATADPYKIAAGLPFQSRANHMLADATRFVPSLSSSKYVNSLVDTKTVLTSNEDDDGRPILFRRHDEVPGLFSVMGAKIDNIYDLLDELPRMDPRFRNVRSQAFLAS